MAGRRLPSHQDGAALLIFLILLVMGGLTYVVSSFTPEMIEAMRQKKTEAALAQARDALLGYAVAFREQQNAIQIQGGNLPPNYVYGYLPLPDFGSTSNTNIGCPWEGCDANLSGSALNKTTVGRFPWRLLGMGPLRDGNGECLWYAVSGSHQRVDKAVPMNWDTLGQLDLIKVNSSGTLVAEGLSEHERPVAIIFSPGAALVTTRNASSTGDATECGGNYTIGDYLESTNLGPSFNFPPAAAPNFVGADTSGSPKPLSTKGKIPAANAPLANDIGLPLTSDILFGAIRKNTNFRNQTIGIGQMFDRMTECARDEIAAGVIAADGSANAKIDAACSLNLDAFGPPGYYPSYRDQVFVATCPACQVTVDNLLASSCAGVLLFGNQRKSGQSRKDPTDKSNAANYLEGDNLTSFSAGGNLYAGHSQLWCVSTVAPVQSLEQDIVRCIPSGASMEASPPSLLGLPSGAVLSGYDPASRTITLGRVNVESDQGYAAGKLFGCVWTPETHASGSGFRSYFRFNISDSGDGFTFVAADGDLNGINACGAGEQHLGYSGNNSYTSPIVFPKIGVEIDTRLNFRSLPPFLPDGFNPSRIIDASTLRSLANGRADPNYAGGHIALVYWGGEVPISTGYACGGGGFCRSPSLCDTDNMCKLRQEEDDNVHGQLPTPPALRPPPGNPVVPPETPPVPVGSASTTPPSPPPYPPYGVDKLDPSLSSVPVGQTIHMRVEVAHAYAGRDDNSRLVRVIATTNLATLSGLPSIDGISLVAGDTVLVTGQVDTTTNGVYVVASGVWARASTADEALELAPGMSWFIHAGTVNRGSLWRLVNTEAPILGVSPLDIQRVRLPVKSVATSNVSYPLAGLTAVGGYTPQEGDRILLTGQSCQRQNGVWLAATGAWRRATPENIASGMKDGAMWYVSAGSSAGTYWRLTHDVLLGADVCPSPDPEPIIIDIAQPSTNDLYAARVTTQVWKETSNANQITRMKNTSSSMSESDPVMRYGTCNSGACPVSDPTGQSCGRTEADGNRYCYAGPAHKPKLYDSQKIYDTRGSACGAGLSCSSGQYCGIDNYCYLPAMRSMRLGFSTSQSTQSQSISINDFFTTWLP